MIQNNGRDEQFEFDADFEAEETSGNDDETDGELYLLAFDESETGPDVDDATLPVSDSPEKGGIFKEFVDWASFLVYGMIIMLVLSLFFFRSITVFGTSMNNTLSDKDKIIALNMMYTPKYGDIVIIQADKLQLQGTSIYGETIIKRVIATAGDTIRIDFVNGVVYRNGVALEEDYIKEPIRDHYSGWMENDREYTVPENCVFVMGDNRNASNDSRNMQDIGFIDTNYIMGKALVRFAPIKSFKWL